MVTVNTVFCGGGGKNIALLKPGVALLPRRVLCQKCQLDLDTYAGSGPHPRERCGKGVLNTRWSCTIARLLWVMSRVSQDSS